MTKSISFDFFANDKASANIRKVGEQVDSLGRKVQAASGTVEIDADTAKVEAAIARLNAQGLKIDADITSAERQLALLRRKAEGATGDLKVEVDADIRQAEARLRALGAARILVDADTTVAHAKLAAIKRGVEDLDGDTANIPVDLDAAGAFGKLAQLGTQLKAVQTPVTLALAVGGAMEALAWIQKVAAGLVSIGGIAVASAGIAKAAFMGVTEAVQALGEEGPDAADKIRESMSKLTPEGQRFAVLLRSLIDGPLKDLQQTAQSEFLPGLQQGIRGFVENLGGARESIAGIARNLGGFFRDIGPSAGRAADALLRMANLGSGAAFSSLSGAVSGMLDDFTRWANSKSADDIAQDIEEIGNTISSVKDKVMFAIDLMQAAWKTLTFQSDSIRDPVKALTELYDAMRNLANNIPGLKGRLPELSQSVRDYGTASSSSASQTQSLADAQQAVLDKMNASKAAFASGEEAQLRYAETLARAREAISKNGATISLNTEKGRANRQTLLDMAGAANRVIETMQGQNAPLATVTARYGQQREALIRTATQMGMTRAQAQAYIDKLLQTPTRRDTNVSAHTAQANANLKGVQDNIRAVKDKTQKTTANTGGATGPLSTVQRLISSLRDKTVTITTTIRNVYEEIRKKIGFSAGGWVPGAPSSVDTVPSMLARGEFVVRSSVAKQWGPLLERINSGASPAEALAATTRLNLASAGVGGGATYNITVPVTNAVVGNEQQVAKVVVATLNSAVRSGTLRLPSK